MAIFYPSYEEIEKMFVSITEGKQYLLKFLKDNLTDDYEVFFQSSISGAMPDVVILHKNHGMMIIEVKEYDLNSYEFDEKQPRKRWCVINEENSNEKAIKSPIKQIDYYHNLFFNYYSSELNYKNAINPIIFASIEKVVFFYNEEGNAPDIDEPYVAVKGCNELKEFFEDKCSGNSYFGEKQSRVFTDEIYRDIKRILAPSEIVIEKSGIRESLAVNSEQKKYINLADMLKIPGRYKRKIRGLPGGGKTITLIKCAIQAAKKDDIFEVLYLTFNITMVNKIKEYLHIFCPDKKIRQKITVIHYHQFVYNYCNKHGLVVEKKTYGEVVPSPIDEDECVTCPPVDADFNVWIPEFPEKYSAIIVDECQDFEKEWIDSLHKGLKDSGIMLFAADERQTIYNRSNTEENSDKIYTGVGGNWPKAFNQQYPYSNKILKMTTAFKNEFIENAEEPEKLKENDDESYLHYISGNGISSSDVCESIINYIKIMDIHINDIAIIAPENEYIRNLEYEFRTKYKQKVITVCETQEQYNRLCAKYPIINNDRKEFDNHLKKLRKTYRVNFRNENGKLKISTIHSFKGWRSKFIVLILDEKFDNAPKSSYNYDKMLYTALTRAEKSILIINNRNTKYHKFFLTHCCDRLPEHLTNICIEQPKPEIIF